MGLVWFGVCELCEDGSAKPMEGMMKSDSEQEQRGVKRRFFV